jgi:DinB superfamily
MKAIDVVRNALQMGDKLANTMLEDMRDAPLTQPAARGGNHPLWVVGHLALAEGRLYQLLLSEPNPVEHWSDLFAGGTEPSTDAKRYPAFDEVLGKYRQLRATTMKKLDSMDDTALDRPARTFGTVGNALTAIAMHQMLHLGQVADARRTAGRTPFFSGPGEPTKK